MDTLKNTKDLEKVPSGVPGLSWSMENLCLASMCFFFFFSEKGNNESTSHSPRARNAGWISPARLRVNFKGWTKDRCADRLKNANDALQQKLWSGKPDFARCSHAVAFTVEICSKLWRNFQWNTITTWLHVQRAELCSEKPVLHAWESSTQPPGTLETDKPTNQMP